METWGDFKYVMVNQNYEDLLNYQMYILGIALLLGSIMAANTYSKAK